MSKEKINLKKLQDNMTDKSQNLWWAGLGMYATVGDESKDLFNKVREAGKDFVEKGRKFEKTSKHKHRKPIVSLNAEDTKKYFEDRVKDLRSVVIEPLGISSHAEVQELTEKVDKLTEMVVVLAQKLDNKATRAKAVAA